MKPAKGPLFERLDKLRPEIARAAQEVLDGWEQDEDGYSEDFGGGGACDAISSAIATIVYNAIEGVELVDGGHDGDDHAWNVVYDDSEAYSVDIPPHVYETGGGYSWQKVDGATVSPDDVVIEPVRRSDVVGSSMASAGVDIGKIASRVASVSVEAARKKPARRAKPRGRSRTILESRTEYACRLDLHISVSFEGEVSKAALLKKLQREIQASTETAVKLTARDLRLEPSDVSIRPSAVDCAVVTDEGED